MGLNSQSSFTVDPHNIRHKTAFWVMPNAFTKCLRMVSFLDLNMYLFCVSDTDKEKLGLGDNFDLVGGESDMGPSAALTPAIWEKTIPYDGENFHLEYMDLEEFLVENGIASLPDVNPLKGSPKGDAIKTEKIQATPSAQMNVSKSASVSPLALLPIQELDHCEEEVVIITNDDSGIICDVTAGEWRLRDQRLDGCRDSVNSYFVYVLQGRKLDFRVK